MKFKWIVWMTCVAIIFTMFGYTIYQDVTAARRFAADGVVVHAEWNTNNTIFTVILG